MSARILIIDDDQDFAEATKMLLEANGYKVSTAATGQEGFAKVKHESPDMVLLDMMMSYKTEGADIAQAIASDAASRQIPIVMITGAHKEMDFPFELRPHDKSLPVKSVLEKPVKPEYLLKIVEKCIQVNSQEHGQTVSKLEELALKWKGKKGNLVMILHEIQNHYGYVPRNVSFELSRILEVPMASIYEVLTFYNYFKLDPPGKHTISVCMGTACYLKGAPQVLKELKRILNVEEEQTTEDKLFHLQVVRCLGCCGLAPVITIDEKVYGKVDAKQVMEILSTYVKQGSKNND
jgi:NADH-quinone oxidoreductase subunit E